MPFCNKSLELQVGNTEISFDMEFFVSGFCFFFSGDEMNVTRTTKFLATV